MTLLADLKARLLRDEAVSAAYVEADAEVQSLEAAIRAHAGVDPVLGDKADVGCASAHHSGIGQEVR